jgi:DNA-binding HxlR family transcriptional regulator
VESTLEVIGGKWKCVILWHVRGRVRRFSELRRLIPGATQKMLTAQLRQLERDGLIERKVYAQVPAKVEYSISAYGRACLRCSKPCASGAWRIATANPFAWLLDENEELHMWKSSLEHPCRKGSAAAKLSASFLLEQKDELIQKKGRHRAGPLFSVLAVRFSVTRTNPPSAGCASSPSRTTTPRFQSFGGLREDRSDESARR